MKWLGLAVGLALVLFTWGTVMKTLVLTRAYAPLLERGVIVGLRRVYLGVAGALKTHERRDNFFSTLAPIVLLVQLAAGLALFLLGHALLFWPFVDGGLAEGARASGSSLFTLGVSGPDGAAPTALLFVAAATGIVVVALYIAYLPTLYGQFNSREAAVSQLEARSGAPPRGAEVLASHHQHGLLDTLPSLYGRWDQLVADVSVAINHYPLLAWFRGQDSRTSWITSLLAILDSAALYAAVAPERAPVECRALVLTSSHALEKVSKTLAFATRAGLAEAAVSAPTHEEFAHEYERLRASGFPVTAGLEDAWETFRAERDQYADRLALLSAAVLAPRAPWAG
ncbi:MAG: hypothetical protein ACR2OD_03320 [Gaiellaceae bacterium]